MKTEFQDILKYRLTKDQGFIDGLYQFPHPKIKNFIFHALVSTMEPWEHVSVTLRPKDKFSKLGINRSPYWPEMCYVKDFFWDKDEVVIQYHPAESDYVSMHPYCLHLWKPIGIVLPVPDPILVGIKKN